MFSAGGGLSSRVTLHEIRFTHISPAGGGYMGSKPGMTNRGVVQGSHIKVTTTPERRFAMTNEDCDTVSFAGMTILLVLCSYAKLPKSEVSI
jgi:hypothetical protein